MNYNWSPGEIAEYDQFLARGNESIDQIVRAFRKMATEQDEPTAMAHLTLSMIGQSNPEALLVLTTVAIRRLAMGT